jgi:nucleotide-binding universal stress UspA family protein
MIKNILWATDFSRESRSCLPYVKFLSRRLNTQNYVLYVLPECSDWVIEAASFSSEDLHRQVEETKKKSREKIGQYGQTMALDLQAVLLEGIASEEIVRYAREKNMDLIVAGRRGLSGIGQLLIGSTTSRLIRKTETPILVIPRSRRKIEIKRILAPVDFNELALVELKYAIFLASQLQVELHVIHVSEFFNYRVPVLKRDQLIKKINEMISRIAEEYDYKIDNIVYELGEPAQKIIEWSKKNKIDLMVMTTNQRRGLEKFFLGSITEKVLLYSDIPLIVLPPSYAASK